ncbi:MAG: ERF family protein [Gammaproteobacteria bacterium]
MTEKTLGIAKAFVEAQKEFAPALKTSTNPHFKSKYVDLAGCVEAVIDALNNHGIALIQKTHDCDNGVKVETVFMHESGEQISGGMIHVPADRQNPQGYGSALTYARRYSLMAACGIAPEDDDGNAASKGWKKPVEYYIPEDDDKPTSMAEKLPPKKVSEVKKS